MSAYTPSYKFIVDNMSIEWSSFSEEVGFIMLGNVFPKETTVTIVSELQKNGRVSPFHFISANAGAAISVCCTVFNFKGPTLNLTVPIDDFGIANSIAAKWLIEKTAKYIFLVTTKYTGVGQYYIENSLLSL